jgi:hypothetical protein
MAVYVIIAARRDKTSGRITHLRMGEADPAIPGWKSRPHEVPVTAALKAIHGGDSVVTSFDVDGVAVVGKEARVRVYDDGTEDLESVSSGDPELKGVEDLPEF